MFISYYLPGSAGGFPVATCYKTDKWISISPFLILLHEELKIISGIKTTLKQLHPAHTRESLFTLLAL